eukprot:6188419-Pleurochrysis_carterae.AAC.3
MDGEGCYYPAVRMPRYCSRFYFIPDCASQAHSRQRGRAAPEECGPRCAAYLPTLPLAFACAWFALA